MASLNRVICALGVACCGWLIVPEALAQTYSLTIVGPGGGVQSSGIALNRSGQVVGAYDNGTRHHAFLYTSGTGAKDLGIYPGFPTGVAYDSLAADVSDSGQAVGSATTATGLVHAFLWENGVMTDLQTLGGPESTALAINNNGAVVGYSDPAPGVLPHAFVWRNGAMADLGVLPGGNESWARDINNAGQVAVNGYTDTSHNTQRCALYNGTQMLLRDPLAGATQCEALGINDAGAIAGSSGVNLATNTQAVVWNPAGVPTPLGKLPSDSFSRAVSLNNAGEVVGTSGNPNSTVGFHYEAGVLRDLNTAVQPGTPAVITEALGVNEIGQIVGAATVSGVSTAVLLTPNYGDANGDFVVDVKDVAAVLKMAAGVAKTNTIWPLDVAPATSSAPRGFGNGRIDIADAVRILRRIRGKETRWP